MVEFDMSHNKIKNVHKEIKNLEFINKINLNNNEIKSIPKNIFKSKRLNALRVNKDTIFPEKIKEYLRKLTIKNEDKNKIFGITIYRD